MYPNSCDTTLGEYLARLRKRKGIAQKHLAGIWGLKGTAPIVAIEKNCRHPTVKTIEQWIQAVEASPIELQIALGIAGYIPITTLPPLEEIISKLTHLLEDLGARNYPAYIVDYRLTLWAANDLTDAITGKSTIKWLMSHHANLFDVFFNTGLGIFGDSPSHMQTKTEQVRRFKQLNIMRQHEPFFCAYPDCMRERLNISKEDYKTFERIWNDTVLSVSSSQPSSSGLQWSMTTSEGTELYFHTVPEVIVSLSNFFIATHLPYHP